MKNVFNRTFKGFLLKFTPSISTTKPTTMIHKNFYLENLSAFDILIEDEDRKQAEAVIYRVFSMLQRDKIWLRDVATEEEIFEEDAELLEEVEEELNELDQKYEFRFDEFYNLVQQEMKKIQSTTKVDPKQDDAEDEDEYEDDDLFSEEDGDDFEEEEDSYDDDLYDEDEDEEDEDAFSHLSDEELDLIEDFILSSAKTRFNFPQFVQDFPDGDEVFVEGEFLLPVIAGKAFGETDTEIAEKMLSSFMMLGYQIEMNELIQMIQQKGKELGPEILAFKIAADSLQEGAHPRDIVRQLEQLLRG
ncbi:hypothetical protein FNJ88_01650 [Chryseobacterium sp. SNU WT5]|uniref:hypothetical protein n=1 Tax=Chryseobacterium sp. SNU WT5 TaxID=2594269 RepID=UPI0011814E8F|nr:hypothetical protein [Chryseobacterium sp. SNU WT5]QDP84320.1 hypothetical protein FNJ88_01650 [Chryseobacterium sp. SNU WT5]